MVVRKYIVDLNLKERFKILVYLDSTLIIKWIDSNCSVSKLTSLESPFVHHVIIFLVYVCDCCLGVVIGWLSILSEWAKIIIIIISTINRSIIQWKACQTLVWWIICRQCIEIGATTRYTPSTCMLNFKIWSWYTIATAYIGTATIVFVIAISSFPLFLVILYQMFLYL